MRRFELTIWTLLVMKALVIIAISAGSRQRTTCESLEWADRRLQRRWPALRKALLAYFGSKGFELMSRGAIYRFIGVHLFGKIVPTGGVWMRRWTLMPMSAWVLEGLSRARARQYRYKAYALELVHVTAIVA
jgi:hypothetical protein